MSGRHQGLVAHYADLIEHEGERARRELRELAEQQPDWTELWALLAQAYLRCLDFAACAAAARRVLALEPEHSDALHFLGTCALCTGDEEGAVAAFERAFAVTRSTASATRLALANHRLGLLDEAVRWNELVLLNGPPGRPDAHWARRNMMSVLRDMGRPLAADHYADALLQLARREPLTVSSALVDLDQSTGYHEWFGLAEKAGLAALLKRGLAAEPGARVPETFELPAERAALARFAAKSPEGTLYIAKPVRGSGGQGIEVTADATALLERADVVVQRYVANPWLVDGRKGHLRIYALIAAAVPLRAYVYSEGIVRFAPEPYDADPARLSDVSMHVTNTALHLDHPGLVISEDPVKEDEGAIWSLSALLRRIGADGGDPDRVFGEISDLVAWFLRLLDREGVFRRQAEGRPPRAFAPKLIGFDILLDAEGHPWLIELQAKPASVGQPLVARINGELYANMFRMGVGCLADDAMSAEALAAVRRDPAAREREIERANLGRFVPLDLG